METFAFIMAGLVFLATFLTDFLISKQIVENRKKNDPMNRLAELGPAELRKLRIKLVLLAPVMMVIMLKAAFSAIIEVVRAGKYFQIIVGLIALLMVYFIVVETHAKWLRISRQIQKNS